MTITAPPLELLPKPSLLIGDQRIDDTSGGAVDHIYGATGKRTAEVDVGRAARNRHRRARGTRCPARMARNHA